MVIFPSKLYLVSFFLQLIYLTISSNNKSSFKNIPPTQYFTSDILSLKEDYFRHLDSSYSNSGSETEEGLIHIISLKFNITEEKLTQIINDEFRFPQYAYSTMYLDNTKINFDTKLNMPQGEHSVTIMFQGSLEKTKLMFAFIPDLISANIFLDTKNLTSMESMFEGCQNLTEVGIYPSTDEGSPNLSILKGIFKDCPKLSRVDLNSLDLSKVQSTEEMFSGCSSLPSVNLNNFYGERLVTMRNMFKDCQSITNLDLSNLNPSNVIYLNGAFQGCKNLLNLDIHNLNTAFAANMKEMFYDCPKLCNIDIPKFTFDNLISEEYGKIIDSCQKTLNINNSEEKQKILKINGCQEDYSDSAFYYFEGKCKECVHPMIIENSQCTSSCSSGYDFIVGRSCYKCPSLCTKCSNEKGCEKCESGFYLKNMDCVQCQKNCAECDGEKGCTQCQEGFFMEQSICMKCPERCITKEEEKKEEKFNKVCIIFITTTCLFAASTVTMLILYIRQKKRSQQARMKKTDKPIEGSNDLIPPQDVPHKQEEIDIIEGMNNMD
ncbi:MAG: BspA family leucine-rich repeat surface protein [archaeon]|nr:BspA family leucine-rich repeat surface protein [archaeon]